MEKQGKKRWQKNYIYSMLWMLLLLVLLGTGCSRPEAVQKPTDTGFVAATVGNYDSADTAVLVRKNLQEQTMTFLNLALGKQYTLSYDGATFYADKYGLAISGEQIKVGELVDITFMKGRKRLNSMSLTPGTFHFDNITNFETVGRKVLMGKEEFFLDQNLAVVTDLGLAELIDLTSVDKLTLVGIDHTIYSIIVEQGHGYLRLENDSYFIGGWIEVSQSLIYPIEEGMLLTVPVGTYPVTVSGGDSYGTDTITVEAGKETSLDVSRWQGEEKFGTVVFTVHPDTTRIYVDGESIDVAKPLDLSYGIHQMIAVADGYQTISKYIKVSSPYSNLDVVLESNSSGQSDSGSQNVSDNSLSENSVSGNGMIGEAISSNQVNPNTESGNTSNTSSNTVSDNQADAGNESAQDSSSVNVNDLPDVTPNGVITDRSTYQVYIDAPVGVEVYVDGSYIGIAPVSFAKQAGSYDVTIRQAGYQTRSYTITVEDTDKDINYSFSDLVPIS